MATKLYFTSNVNKAVNLENYEEFENSPFKVLGTSVKTPNSEGELKKVKKPTKDVLDNPQTRVFMTLDIDDLEDHILLEMGVANKFGFQKIINVDGETFSLKDGATISRMGSTFEFGIK